MRAVGTIAYVGKITAIFVGLLLVSLLVVIGLIVVIAFLFFGMSMPS